MLTSKLNFIGLRAVLGISALLLAGFFTLSNAAQSQVIAIGTGGMSGIYYPAGEAICRLVNRGESEHGIRCLANLTAGSVYNLNAIKSGELDLAIVQSDWQNHAYKGTSEFQQQGPNSDLRAVFSLHSEPFTVVARKDSGIKTFADLRGKRVNIGNPGSGQRATMDVLMAAKGWSKNDFSLASELSPADQSQAMCDNKVDAIVYIVGHPNRSILEATTACDSLLVPVIDPEIEKLIQNTSYYTPAVIPGGMYRGNPTDVKTFGVRATLVTSIRIPEETIYWVVKSVFDNLDEFRSLNPALTDLVAKAMVVEGNSAPLHPGAVRYFKSAGLLDPDSVL